MQGYLGVGQGQVRGAAMRQAGEEAGTPQDGGDDGSFMEALPQGVSAGGGDDDEDPYMAGQAGTPGEDIQSAHHPSHPRWCCLCT